MLKQRPNKFAFKPSPGERNLQPSKTIQDDSYTIKELYERFTNGIIPDRKRYDYLDTNIEDINRLYSPDVDLLDVHNMVNKSDQIASEIKSIDDKIEADKKAKIESQLKELEILKSQKKPE